MHIATCIATCVWLPLQDLPLKSNWYPLLQEHWKLPTVLVHICSQGDDKHSSVSIRHAMHIKLYVTVFAIARLVCKNYKVFRNSQFILSRQGVLWMQFL